MLAFYIRRLHFAKRPFLSLFLSFFFFCFILLVHYQNDPIVCKWCSDLFNRFIYSKNKNEPTLNKKKSKFRRIQSETKSKLNNPFDFALTFAFFTFVESFFFFFINFVKR